VQRVCLTKKIFSSWAVIGALIAKVELGQCKDEYIHKLTIPLIESNGTRYGLHHLHDTHYLDLESLFKTD
jgi:hypothetical protein